MINKYLPIYWNIRDHNPLDIIIDFSSLTAIPLSCFNSNSIKFIPVFNQAYYTSVDKKTLSYKLMKKGLMVNNLNMLTYPEQRQFREDLSKVNIDVVQTAYKATYKKYVSAVMSTALGISNLEYSTEGRIHANYIQTLQTIFNKTRIASCFQRGNTGYYSLNNHKIIVNNFSLYSSETEGIYPLLITGVYNTRISNYKKNIIDKMFLTTNTENTTNWDCIRVYVDCNWYLNTPLKSLKNHIFRVLENAYPGFELVLFDGKKFANENMYTYQIPNFRTLALKKTFIRKIEKDIFNDLTDKFTAVDYSTKIQEFIALYQKAVDEQKNAPVVEKAVQITEERALTAEDMELIRSLSVNDELVDMDVEYEGNLEGNLDDDGTRPELPREDTNLEPAMMYGGMFAQMDGTIRHHYSELTPETISSVIRNLYYGSSGQDSLPYIAPPTPPIFNDESNAT